MSILPLILKDLYPLITRYLEPHCNPNETFSTIFRFINDPRETDRVVFPYFPDYKRNIMLHIDSGFGVGKCDTLYCHNFDKFVYKLHPQLWHLCESCNINIHSSNKNSLKSAECVKLDSCDICFKRFYCLREDECIFCSSKNKKDSINIEHAWIP